MIEQSRRPLLSSSNDLTTLQQRANRQRNRHRQEQHAASYVQQARTIIGNPFRSAKRLPTRYLLHTLVALILPAAVLLTQLKPDAPQVAVRPAAPQGNIGSADFIAPVAPLSLDVPVQEGDAPLLDDNEIPVPLSLTSRSAALGPMMVEATISGERVYLRNGPGTNYDAVGKLTENAPLQVIGKYGDWFQVRESVDKPTYWVSGELLTMPEGAPNMLDEIAAEAIPAPPPPKVAQVREQGLQLRDGPGKNYVSMGKLPTGTQLDLLEQYQGWFHVGVPNGKDGWVKGEFLNVAEGVINRVTVADALPNPNPAMVGTINEGSVNVRKGPDSKYDSLGKLGNGVQVDLIGKYKDWFKVKTPRGTVAWVFNDFLNATAHVMRRVPTTNDFPGLPRAVAASTRSSSGRGGNAYASIAPSGDVASFAAKFVGAGYRWGGTGPSAFDCSGLMVYTYRRFGVSLPRTAAAQYGAGARISSIGALAPGDLVFFTNTGGGRGITHVAMYIGGGRIVHAMTPRYGVQISSLYERYWSSHFYGGTRVRR